MLRPITNWSDLRRALEAQGKEIFVCQECGQIMLAEQAPARCTRDGCRALANGRRRSTRGRPFETCPQCEATDPKHPHKECFGQPHAFHTGQ